MANWKYNLFLKVYGWAKLPLLAFAGPKIIEFTDTRCVVKIPLGYRSRNHLNTMYFGALAIGAELSIAAASVFAIQKRQRKIDFIFKDFQCQFLKRADGDVHFICNEIAGVFELVDETTRTGERVEKTMKGYAIVPSKGEDHVIEYTLTLSMKDRTKR